jgi:hypothetical protein
LWDWFSVAMWCCGAIVFGLQAKRFLRSEA